MSTNNHRLELVGGEWEGGKRNIGNYMDTGLPLFSLQVWRDNELKIYGWEVFWDLDASAPLLGGKARTKALAQAEAEAALLEEIAKFVRVKE